MSFTVLGAGGFIGARLTAFLRAAGEEVLTPGRDGETYLDRELGHVIYCIGVTADFRSRPLDTVEAHVVNLLPLLRRGKFQSLLYLSSTRIYRGTELADENDALTVRPGASDDLYNLSKLMGESACLASGRAGVRVARLSNVYGPAMGHANFLAAVIGEALGAPRVVLRTTLDSCKDYVAVEDVVAMLPRIACTGRHRIYNLASGTNVTNAALVDWLARLTGCLVAVAPDAARTMFPPISVGRLAREFGYEPAALEKELPVLVRLWRERMVAA